MDISKQALLNQRFGEFAQALSDETGEPIFAGLTVLKWNNDTVVSSIMLPIPTKQRIKMLDIMGRALTICIERLRAQINDATK